MPTREPGSSDHHVCDAQKLGVDELCTAMRKSFLGCPPDRWSHGAFGVDDLEDRVEDELGGDAEFESAIEAPVGAL